MLTVLVAAPAMAQNTTAEDLGQSSRIISPGEVTPTPEMWFYQQYQREYLDPKLAVRKKAEFRSQQRKRRLAAQRWFGYSPQRPLASSDPFHGDYSPRWTSNNAVYPFRWSGVGRPWIALQIDGTTRWY
jgi:hypothetical protein